MSNFTLAQGQALSAERGLDPLTFERLRDRSLISSVYVQKFKARCIAFPLQDKDGNPYRAHARAPHPDNDGKWSWAYEPVSDPLGRPVPPLWIGNPASASRAFLFESQWDGIALIERLALFPEIDSGEVCVIATRGAQNAAKIKAIAWAGGVSLYAFPQNDPPGRKWLTDILTITGGLYVVESPPAHKDLGDWVKDPAFDVTTLDWEIDNAPLRQPGTAGSSSTAPNQTQVRRERLKSLLQPLCISDLPDKAPQQLIEGVLYQGGKMSISSGSKTYKSWNLLHVLFCIANRLPYLGWPTPGVPVLIFDFELIGYDCRFRLEQIAKRYPKIPDPFKNIRIVPLRGKFLSFGDELTQEVAAEVIKDTKVAAFALDPLYKALGEHDENLTSDVAQVLLPFEKLTVDCSVSFLYDQHFSKGNQSLKEALDRIGGSGTFARDPDSILIFTPHKEPGCFTVELVLRSFKEIPPFVVRWDFPIFVREWQLDPEDLKLPKRFGNLKGQQDFKLIMAALAAAESSGGLSYVKLREATGIANSTFNRRLNSLEAKGEIIHSKLTGTYQLSVKNAQKWNQNP